MRSPYHDREAPWGYCILTDTDKHKTGQAEPLMMYATADQGDYPNIEPIVKTRFNFGCVMFEGKKARDQPPTINHQKGS